MGQSSGSSDPPEPAVIAASLPSSAKSEYQRSGQDPYRLDGVSAGTRNTSGVSYVDGGEPYYNQPSQTSAAANVPVNAQQQQHFLGHEPAASYDPPADNHSTYGDWMAPAAAGVAGAGVGAAAVATHRPSGHPNDAATQAQNQASEEPKAVHNVNAGAFSTNTSALHEHTAGHDDVVGGTTVSQVPTDSAAAVIPLAGNENEGAHETGAFFPRVVRHDTEMSVSNLHIPGEFPKRT